MPGSRFYGPEYNKARTAVLKRDGYKCKDCGDTKRYRLQVHHIKKWADYPTLRYSPGNMLTLCKKCHQKLWSKEEDWESYCLLLLNKDKNLDISYQLWKARNEE